MTKRYRLELYIIRENELEFALYDKEAENSQGTVKMVEKKLNRQDERITELESKLEEVTNKLVVMDLPIEFEQWYYTTIAEPSENYNEEVLSKITNALLGGN